jgi:radical SAM-linked protein
VSESRQRWRLVFARDEEARYLSHLDAAHLWERAMRRGGIPVAMSEGFSPRPRLVFGAPLPLGMLAEHDLADLFVSERLTRLEMRQRLTAGMPRGYRLVDLWDEWVGAPALATQLDAADYRLTLLGAAPARLEGPAREMLQAEALPREKKREKKVTAYDLRPLVLALRMGELKATDDLAAPARLEGDRPGERPDGRDGGQAVAALWMRLRHSQDRGSGRPEEVVAELADRAGMAVISFDTAELGAAASDAPREAVPAGTAEPDGGPERAQLEIVRPVRERLWLRGEAPVDATGPAT